jgi:cytochrome oxidase Cu insertion factor (SCO1/SenC/PrrC family)
MIKLMSVYPVALAGAGVFAAALSAGGPPRQPPQSGGPTELKAGDPAPPFALPGSDGKVHKLSDYKGKTVVLAWFPKAFTGG